MKWTWHTGKIWYQINLTLFTIYRYEDLKIVKESKLDTSYFMFNLTSDPFETTDISDSFPEQKEKLYNRMLEASKDAWPKNNYKEINIQVKNHFEKFFFKGKAETVQSVDWCFPWGY